MSPSAPMSLFANHPLFIYQGGQVARPEFKYDYLLGQQGIVKRIDNHLVSADHLIVPISGELTGLGLKTYSLSPILLKVPRIPGALLQHVLEDARRNVQEEFMYYYKYDPARQEWLVLRPQQSRSSHSVRFEADMDPWIVVDCHSHNTMRAFWSPTDDDDELDGRFYTVMGRVESPAPQLGVRLGLYGRYWIYDVPAEVLFEDISPFVQVPTVPSHLGHMYPPLGELGDYYFVEQQR